MEENQSSLFGSQLQEIIEDQEFPDVVILEEGGKSFRFEYAMERLSLHPTQYKDIWPEYE